MQRLKPFPNGCEFRLRGLAADAGLQPAFDFEGVLAAVLQRIFGSGVETLPHHRGKIEVRTNVFVRAGETLRDASDRVRYVWRIGADRDDGARLQNGYGAQEQCVSQAEDGAVGADSQRERKSRD